MKVLTGRFVPLSLSPKSEGIRRRSKRGPLGGLPSAHADVLLRHQGKVFFSPSFFSRRRGTAMPSFTLPPEGSKSPTLGYWLAADDPFSSFFSCSRASESASSGLSFLSVGRRLRLFRKQPFLLSSFPFPLSTRRP